MILLQEVPVPPPPPQAPTSELSVSGSLEDMAAVVLLLGVGLILATLIWPLIKAIARRIEGGSASVEAQAELDGLRERVRQLEQMQPRMAELEERVDFAERLLAQPQPTARAEGTAGGSGR